MASAAPSATAASAAAAATAAPSTATSGSSSSSSSKVGKLPPLSATAPTLSGFELPGLGSAPSSVRKPALAAGGTTSAASSARPARQPVSPEQRKAWPVLGYFSDVQHYQVLGGGGGGASSTPQAGSVEAAKAAYTALFGTGDDALLDEDLMARIKLERFALVRIQSQPWCHSLVQSLGTALFGAVQPQGPPSSMHAHSAVVKLQRRLLAASFIAHTGMPCVAFGEDKFVTLCHNFRGTTGEQVNTYAHGTQALQLVQFLAVHTVGHYLRALGGLGMLAPGGTDDGVARLPPPPRMKLKQELRGSVLWLERGAELRKLLSGAFVTVLQSACCDPETHTPLLDWLDAVTEKRLERVPPPAQGSGDRTTPVAMLRPATTTDAAATTSPPQLPITVSGMVRVSTWLLDTTLALRAIWARCAHLLDCGWSTVQDPFDPVAAPAAAAAAAQAASGGAGPGAGAGTAAATAPGTPKRLGVRVPGRLATWATSTCAPRPSPQFTLSGIISAAPYKRQDVTTVTYDDASGGDGDDNNDKRKSTTITAPCTVAAACVAFVNAESGEPMGGALMRAAAPEVLGRLAVTAEPQAGVDVDLASGSGDGIVPAAPAAKGATISGIPLGTVAPAAMSCVVVHAGGVGDFGVAAVSAAAGRAYWSGGGNSEQYYQQVELQQWSGYKPQCSWLGCTYDASKSDKKGTKDEAPRKFQKCSRCRLVWYCSRDCQAQAWKSGHKRRCKLLAGTLGWLQTKQDLDVNTHLARTLKHAQGGNSGSTKKNKTDGGSATSSS